ncbi:MAG: hypothetical protein KJZ54_10010 [Phycisphaerales bacterium]|nr:hypothetical protein [Phycisphaerales bacterium]
MAVYRVLHWKDGGGWTFDADPKERLVYHNAGLAGGGGSSYIDAVILRDRDANTAWEDEADGTLDEGVSRGLGRMSTDCAQRRVIRGVERIDLTHHCAERGEEGGGRE